MIRKIKELVKQSYRFWEFKHNEVFVSKGSYVHPSTSIGFRTRINGPSYIDKCNIGKYCAIGGRLVVRSSNHYVNYANMQDHFQRSTLKSRTFVSGKCDKDIVIGNGVWIGDSVIILPEVEVGDGCVIGAGSIVTKDIPPYSIAVGNPARVIKKRFSDDIIDFFKDIEWWNWDSEKIERNKFIFDINFQSSEVSIEKIKERLS